MGCEYKERRFGRGNRQKIGETWFDFEASKAKKWSSQSSVCLSHGVECTRTHAHTEEETRRPPR
jgi:hypothetical protein